MKIAIIEVPKKIWSRVDFQSAIEDAFVAARKIAKKVDIKHQRSIFSLSCNHIERIAAENGNKIMELGGKDAYKFLTALKTDRNVLYPFVLPEEVSKFRKQFKGKISKMLKKIDGGIVVILLPYEEPLRNFQIKLIHRSVKKPNTQYKNLLPIFSLPKNVRSSRYKEYYHKAYQRLNEAILFNKPFNASAFPHRVFTELIRNYIYKPSISFWYRLLKWLIFWRKIKPILLPIVYHDGSEANPFPLFSLPRISKPKDLPIIKVGLMSMRHSETLDPLVDVYLLRNVEVDKRESSAEQDDMAYNRAVEFFSELLKNENGIEVHLYHTGLEPVVVGTYRAVVKMLQNFQGRLVVTPKFPVIKRGKVIDYESGECWY